MLTFLILVEAAPVWVVYTHTKQITKSSVGRNLIFFLSFFLQFCLKEIISEAMSREIY